MYETQHDVYESSSYNTAHTFESTEDAARFEQPHRLAKHHLCIRFWHLVDDVRVLNQVERLVREVRQLGVVLVEEHVVAARPLLLPQVAEPDVKHITERPVTFLTSHVLLKHDAIAAVG